ncbi:immunoglobulin-like domain-containing protein [Ureibacillus acetophenoni]
MKIRIILIALIGLTLFMSACSSNIAESDIDKLIESEYGDLPDQLHKGQTKIEVTTDKKAYSTNVNEIILRIANTGTTSVGFGNPLYVEKLINGTWYQIPYKRLAFTDITLGIDHNSNEEQEVPHEHLYYQFTEGNYRIIKEFYINEDVFVLGAEFEIKD